jgi:shikimate dehydrogenase
VPDAAGRAVEITGSTRLAAVIGSPVGHSRSPAIINAAFAAGGIDWRFVAFEVDPGRAVEAVDAMRALRLGGLSVTMPHKADVIAGLDRVSPVAEALGAVNCIAWEGTELVGHNTDGEGLLAALAADQGFDPAGRSCVVLGAGGAARSVVHALGRVGAARVTVVNRTPERAEAAAALAGDVGRVGEVDQVQDADLVINATSVGMGAAPGSTEPTPVPSHLLRSGQTVVDLVYQPLATPLLTAAAAQGAIAVDGIGMLVHQAALAITRWTGVEPDIGAMQRAARQ